ARAQVARDDRVDGAVWILVVLEVGARRDVFAVIQRRPVRRRGGLAGVLLDARACRELQSLGATPVVLPDLTGAERARADDMPARVDRQPVARPLRAVDEPLGVLRHLRGVLALAVDGPDVPTPPAISRDGDASPVRT